MSASEASTPIAGGKLIALQYLRGFCVLGVVILHSARMASQPNYFGPALWHDILSVGVNGVDIFFVISGFIISYVNLGAIDLRAKLGRGQYALRRFNRIVPLMWIAILSHCGLRLLFGAKDFGLDVYLRALVLWPWGYIEPMVLWSLRVEFAFYIVFALIFLGNCRLRPLMALWVVAPLLLPALVGGIFDPAFHSDPLHILISGSNLEFGAGLIVGIAARKYALRATWRLPIHPFFVVGLAFFGSLAVIAIADLAWHSAAACALVAAVGGPTVYLCARLRCGEDALSRFGQLMGDASYAIYLFHLHVASAACVLLHKLAPGMAGPLVTPIVVVIAFIGGVAIHLVIERPLVRWTARLEGPRQHISPGIIA